MNNKRFKVCIDNNNGVGLFDNSVKLLFIKFTNKEDAVSCKDSLKHQCNLMNELYDEKEQLKQQIEIEKKWQFEKDKYYVKIKEENENLQKQVKSFETTMNATSDYNAHLESKITTLEKENEQLKQKVDFYKYFQKDARELEKENEQLKKRNKFLEEFDGRAKTVANLKEENKQLKEEIRAYPINEQYAEEIIQQNQKLRIERNDLRIQNKKLKQKLEILDLKEKNNTTKIIDGKFFIKM